MLHRLEHLPAIHQHVRVVGALMTPLTLHGVTLTPISDKEVSGLETMVLQTVRLSRGSLG